MKQQYLVGIGVEKRFIRIADGITLIGGSLTLEEAKEAQRIFKCSKIYKLVEVKK